jgi:thioredoxin 1
MAERAFHETRRSTADAASRYRKATMNRLLACCILLFGVAAHGADGPYDERANAKREIRLAVSQAAKAHVPVLLVFGANWCGDCKVLDMAMKEGASAPLVARDFRVVKINVGKFDRNLDVAETYGVPLKKGIPAVAVLDADSKVLYATRGGELADARKMGEDGLHAFFTRISRETKPRS